MWISEAASFLERVAKRVSGALLSVSGIALTLMMFLTFADVCLRYIFNRPIDGAFELITYMMAIAVGFSISYCAVKKGHVRVDVVVGRLPQQVQGIILSITSLVGLVFFSLVSWQGVLYVKDMFDFKWASSVLLIPAFPFVAVVAFGFAVFCLTLLTDFLEILSRAVKK